MVDPFHLLGGMPDIGSDFGGQLLIANDVLVGGSLAVAENAEDSGVELVSRRLNHFLFDHDGLEAKAARGVLESTCRKVIDVLGIEFLERRVEIVVVTSGVRSLQINAASGREKPSGGCEECGDIVNVFEHMAEYDAIKSGQARGSRANRPDIGLKATIVARGCAARRRIESGYCRESLVAEGSEQAARGAPGV